MGNPTLMKVKGDQALREDFPTLKQLGTDGRLIAYLDSAASSQTAESVLRSIEHYYGTCRSNVHRGIYAISERATKAYSYSHVKAASFVGCKAYWNDDEDDIDSSEMILTSGITESLNLLMYSLAKTHVQTDDRIVTTVMEHHSNLVPWQQPAKSKRLELKFVEIDADGKAPP